MDKDTGKIIQTPEGVGFDERGAATGGARDMVYTGQKSPEGVVLGNGSDGILIPGGLLNLVPLSSEKVVRNIGSEDVQRILNRGGDNGGL